MATSFVEFQGYSFWSTDYSLNDWQNFLGSEIGKIPGKPAWLADFREHLRQQNHMAGSASMDPGLDDFLTNEERKTLLIELVRQTITRIEGYGGTISVDELLEMGLGAKNSKRNWPSETTTTTEPILNIGNAYLRLLPGEIKTTAASSPLMDSRKS